MHVHVIEQPPDDPAWDEFLAAQPTGHHLQSSPWGQLKARFGWQIIRILAQEGDQILGGAQILTRRLPIWGKIGYISKGPVVLPGRSDVVEVLVDHIEEVARTHRLLVLSIQPPAEEPLYLDPLAMRDFTPSGFYIVPPTTVLVDLQQTEETILRQMKKKTRYYVRTAMRKGVTAREGTEADLPTFYELMKATATRSDYIHYDLDYYQEAWRQFAPRGMLKMFFADYQDEPLAAVMIIAFGQWAVYKWGASSDAHRDTMPNYLLQWTAIRWSKHKGCLYYDLGGITPASVAEDLRQGQKLNPTDSKGAGIAHFKHGFGQLVTFPDAYDNCYGVRPKWLARTAIAYAGRLGTLRALVLGGADVWKHKARALTHNQPSQAVLPAGPEGEA